MALGVCIPDLVAQGKIPEAKAADILALYSELVAQYEGKFGRDAAESMATTQALKTLERQTLQRKRQALLQARAQQRVMDNSRRLYDGGAAGKPTGDAMLAHLVRDEKAPYANVEYRWLRLKGQARSMIDDILRQHRASLTGELRNKGDLDLIVRELHGQDTGDLNAKEMADSWRQVGEMLRQRFNQAGGHIGKLEGWALPQSHDSLAVGSVTADEWIGEVMPRLDRAKMIDDSTGLPFSTEKLGLVLRDVYETIVSEGWSNRTPGAMGKPAMGNRHAEHRFLHFKSADDWLSYNGRFGGNDPFAAMLDHIEYMSRDIAMMEILGPNPAATVKWMKDVVAKEASTTGAMADRMGLTVAEFQIDSVMKQITGQNNRPVNRALALFGSTIRNWQTSTKLGGAALTSISDVATQALTRAYNGLPTKGILIDYAKQLNPLDDGDRAFARRTWLIGDEYAGRVGHSGRMHMDEVFGGRLADGSGQMIHRLEQSAEVTRRLADGTLRVSGLNALTNAGRAAMGMEFMNALATFADKDFDALNAPFRNFLRRYGIDSAGWNSIRTTPMTDWKGAQWIRPDDISDRALADRLMEGIMTEVDFAIPTGGLQLRALVNAVPRGTVLGEIIRTGFQFKMFPITVTHMHGGRMMGQSALHKKAIYTAAFLGMTTLTGMMAYQMSEISKGRDPMPMLDEETGINMDLIRQGMLKGGGLGIYGDVLNNSFNEYGQSVGDITAGPAFGTAQNIADLVSEGDVARFMKRETPGGSIWWLRAAYERLLIDTVADWQDGEKAAKRYERMERAAEKEGTGYWAPPGEGMEAWRAPDFANAFRMAPVDEEEGVE